jgi:hypothetical protein
LDNNFKLNENSLKQIKNNFKVLNELLVKEFKEIRAMIDMNQPAAANSTQV